MTLVIGVPWSNSVGTGTSDSTTPVEFSKISPLEKGDPLRDSEKDRTCRPDCSARLPTPPALREPKVRDRPSPAASFTTPSFLRMDALRERLRDAGDSDSGASQSGDSSSLKAGWTWPVLVKRFSARLRRRLGLVESISFYSREGHRSTGTMVRKQIQSHSPREAAGVVRLGKTWRLVVMTNIT